MTQLCGRIARVHRISTPRIRIGGPDQRGTGALASGGTPCDRKEGERSCGVLIPTHARKRSHGDAGPIEACNRRALAISGATRRAHPRNRRAKTGAKGRRNAELFGEYSCAITKLGIGR